MPTHTGYNFTSRELQNSGCLWTVMNVYLKGKATCDSTHTNHSLQSVPSAVAEKAKAWEYLCSKLFDNFEIKNNKNKNECVQFPFGTNKIISKFVFHRAY